MKLWTPPVSDRLSERVNDLDASLAKARPGECEQAWLLDLIRTSGPALVRLLWRLLGKEQDVLDAYQECFVRLLSSDAVRDGPLSRRYVFQTAMHIAIDMRRRRKVRQDHLRPLAMDRPPAPLASITPRPSFVELMDLLRRAVDSLPDRLRDVIVLRDLAEMSYRDVAEVLSITPGTARVYRREAIVELSKRLREYEQYF